MTSQDDMNLQEHMTSQDDMNLQEHMTSQDVKLLHINI